ncbi:flagellar transcriptional regulator FlhD [Pseudidiomarina insulisalsae]|uniref:Flagellar transcriptional regulator FlhD n=1 Tax=Pseudidiomarina insulisalsae TaxID=575789 RepID=A0A432YDW7_9GAMM|nr:flagellar transcriptional regulator FlhD [Pseudidiomarina insulisalsae]RUO59066.1 flagellar transcriptional regulator FlhD [Pseudidiomarina insulisalsae]
MAQQTVLAELQEINLSYLLLVQKLLNEDRELALFRLKIDEELADFIGDLSIRELTMLAKQPQVLLRPCLCDVTALREVLSNNKAEGMRETHLAMLMAAATA